MKKESKKVYILKFILFIVIFFMTIKIFGQEDTNQFEIALEKIEFLRGESNFDQALSLLQQIESKAIKINSDYLPQIYSEYVKFYFATNNNSLAKDMMYKAESSSKKFNTPQAIAYKYYTKAYYYNYLDIRNLAVENSQSALDIAIKYNLENIKPRIYYILYGAYSNFDQVNQAQNYANLTIKSSKKVKNYNLLSNGYSAKSIVMEYLYKKEQNQTYKDSILIYLKESSSLYKKYPDKISTKTYAITNINIANYYYQNENISKKDINDSIKKYVNIAKNITKNKENTTSIQANANGILAMLALNEGNSSYAEQLLIKSLIDLNLQKNPDYYTIISITDALSNLYKTNKNYEKAFSLKEEKEKYTNLLYNQKQLEKIFRLEAEFENKQIKQEIEIITKLAKNRKLLNYLYISITILALFSLFIIFIFYRNKTKLQIEKELRLKKENDEAKAKALLKEKEKRLLSIQKLQMEKQVKMQIQLEKEEKARMKAEQELLHLKNEQMQKEILSNTLQIERKNKLLKEIKDRIKEDGESFNIERVFRNEKYLEEIINQTVKEFQDIHPTFFDKLKKLSNDKLTSLDLKYCAYIYLKLSTKEIATIFNVEITSVRMSKYRIKQKLNIKTNNTLEDFLQNILSDNSKS